VVDELDTLNGENERFLVWWLVASIGPKHNVIAITMTRPRSERNWTLKGVFGNTLLREIFDYEAQS
jgi:hypothetical protein